MDASLNRRRVWLIAWIFSAVFAVIAARLVQVQFISPQEPEFASEGTARRIIRPALRGTITDIHGQPMSLSQHVVTVRADPVKLGMFAPEVARLVAPLLSLPEAEALARMQPQKYWASVRETNATRVVTNRVERVRRDNVLQTDVPYAQWEAVEETLRRFEFAEERQLKTARTNILRRFREQRREMGWWNFPRLKLAKEQRTAALRAIYPRLRYCVTNAAETRANGLYPEVMETRVYPHGHLASHVLGFTTNGLASSSLRVPPRLHGAQGIEQRFDAELQGSHGVLETHKVGSRELVPLRERDLPATDGLNVRLTLDLNLQSILEAALDEAVDRLKPKSISAIMVRPRTGEILALGNRPTYDPNTRRIPSLDAMLNRAVKLPAEPGSTFKVITYAAVLNEHAARLDEPIDCEQGRWQVPGIPGRGRWINDDQGHKEGVITVEEAFAKSSNVGAVKLGLRLSTNVFLKYIRDFGIGSRSGIECAEFGVLTNWVNGVEQVRRVHGEPAGGVPRWDRLTPSSLPFGYGLYVTPLQTAMAAAALPNDGVLMEPRLVRSVETSDGRIVREFPAKPVRRVVRSETARQMLQIMRTAVDEGTGGQAALEEYVVGGKTGTAKKVHEKQYSSSHYYASFVGYVAGEEPEIVIMVNADEPTTAGRSYYGGKACAPVFQRIASEAASYLALKPAVVATNKIAFTPSRAAHAGGH